MRGIKQIDIDCYNLHNEIRRNPKSLIPQLQQMIPNFRGGKYTVDGNTTNT